MIEYVSFKEDSGVSSASTSLLIIIAVASNLLKFGSCRSVSGVALFKIQALHHVEAFHPHDSSSTPSSSTTNTAGNNSAFGDLFNTTTT